MWTLENLFDLARHNQREIRPGVWVPARPYPDPFGWRVKDAWAVLRGRADTFMWPEDDLPADEEHD